jgi:tetratricopeptide (TPR) repeat protein
LVQAISGLGGILQHACSWALSNLGSIAFHQGRYDEAVIFYSESLILCRDGGYRLVAERCLKGMAGAACATGYYEKAARLFGAAELLQETLGWPSYPPDKVYYDKCVVSTRAALGGAAFAVAWAV